MSFNRSLSDYLDVNETAVQSCTDLGGCNCEGQLWFKIKVYECRWCVLVENILHLSKDRTATEDEVAIRILNCRITPVVKSRSKNFYFKIQTSNETFMFGTSSKIDYIKWLNKLNLSAAGVNINDEDGPVGGFTSGFIIEPLSSLKLNWNLPNRDQTLEFEQGRTMRQMSIDSNDSIPQGSIKDSRLEIFYDRSLSENNSPKNPSHPTVPPRRYSLKRSKTTEEVNRENHHVSADRESNDKKEISPSIVSSMSEEDIGLDKNEDNNQTLDATNSLCKPRSIEKISNKTIETNACKYPSQLNTLNEEDENDVEATNLANIDPGSPFKQINCNKAKHGVDKSSVEETSSHKSSESQINLIKKITERERLIRNKSRMVAKIDLVLRNLHLQDTVHEFWDDHGEEILKIISR